jgi:hypothetical protein
MGKSKQSIRQGRGCRLKYQNFNYLKDYSEVEEQCPEILFFPESGFP